MGYDFFFIKRLFEVIFRIYGIGWIAICYKKIIYENNWDWVYRGGGWFLSSSTCDFQMVSGE